MPISSWWLQGALLTCLIGFSILGVLAYVACQQQPPIPARVVTASAENQSLLTSQNIARPSGGRVMTIS